MRARDAAKFLRAFGDGTRLRILFLLARSALPVRALAQALRCPGKRVSRHLQYLAARRVVESETRGRRVVYCLSPAGDRLHKGALSAVQACRDLVEETNADASRVASQEQG
ncbi:MAG TPA: metalloregulator ArsR/SmtB family transcription factor [Planctomycetota bacterium]|nr:metalloregulator ArsR/SmtB family transcription factor [Planctomycetota bacterium]